MFPWIVLNTWVHLYLRTREHEDGETAATRVRMSLHEDGEPAAARVREQKDFTEIGMKN
jgi:hypothetical protein